MKDKKDKNGDDIFIDNAATLRNALDNIVEKIKDEMLLSLLDSIFDSEEDKCFMAFLKSLLKNGCPAEAIIKTMKELVDDERTC